MICITDFLAHIRLTMKLQEQMLKNICETWQLTITEGKAVSYTHLKFQDRKALLQSQAQRRKSPGEASDFREPPRAYHRHPDLSLIHISCRPQAAYPSHLCETDSFLYI